MPPFTKIKLLEDRAKNFLMIVDDAKVSKNTIPYERVHTSSTTINRGAAMYSAA